MSSLHSDKGWLFVAFRLGGRQVRLYLGLRDTRANRRSTAVIQDLILRREWEQLARKFPLCKQLERFQPAFTPDATTFEQAAKRFLAYQINANKPATVIFYRTIIEKHLGGEFCHKPIRLIGASDIAALYAPVAQRGHQAQAQNIRRVVSAVFQWARGERGSDGDYLVGDNPVARTRPVAAGDTDRNRVNPFTAEEIIAIIAGCRPGWERRIVTLAFETGLRPSELFGLKRKDIELGGPSTALGQISGLQTAPLSRGGPPFLHIRQTYSRFGVGDVKNRGSRRSVPLTDAAVRALREQLAEVELRSVWLWPINAGRSLGGKVAEKREHGVTLRKDTPSQARPHNPQNFSKRNWPAILKRAGVNHRSFYQCRHTYAMRLLAEGVPMPEIARRMGHTNLQMLIDHYLKWPVEREKPERMKR